MFREFNDDSEHTLIPDWLFEARRTMTIRLPYCELNEKQSIQFLNKLSNYVNDKYIIRIIWETRKIRTLFPLKDKIEHKACVIYEGKCSCGESYIGETERNAFDRWNEHDKPSKNSEPAKHLLKHPTHKFEWNILTPAPKINFKRKIMEANFIAKSPPTLNDQKTSYILILFRHGVT